MLPKEVIKQWVKLFNQCDANALADLYHENPKPPTKLFNNSI